jgi:hypothetical protein
MLALTLTAVAVSLLLAQSVLAWVLARREPMHRSVALGSSVLVGVNTAPVIAAMAGVDPHPLQAGATIGGACGLWSVARCVMEPPPQHRWVVALAAAAVVLAAAMFHPAVDVAMQIWTRDAVWVASVVGIWWSTYRAMVRRPPVEPRISHLVVLLHACVVTTALAMTEEPAWAAVLPWVAASAAGVVAQIAWLVGHPPEGKDVELGSELLRPAERMGDLVDLARPVPSRAARRPSPNGSVGEP